MSMSRSRSSSNNTTAPLLSPSSASGSSDSEQNRTSTFITTHPRRRSRAIISDNRVGRLANHERQRLNDEHTAVSAPVTPLHAVSYVHGSYAAASPAFVRCGDFRRVLRRLLPSAYRELTSLMKGCDFDGERRGVVDGRDANHRIDGDGNNVIEASFATEVTMNRPDPVKLMKWAENNPVVSAYGIWMGDAGRRTLRYPRHDALNRNNDNDDGNNNDDFHSDKGSDRDEGELVNAKSAFRQRHHLHDKDYDNHHNNTTTKDATTTTRTFEIRSRNKPALEWDVFLDPKLIRRVSSAMDAADGIERRINANRHKRRLRPSRNTTATTTTNTQKEEEDENDFDFDLHQSHTAAQVEVDRLVSQLMKRTILAHGSMSQLVLEAFGVARDYNYNSVVKGARRIDRCDVKETKKGGSSHRGKESQYVWDKREERLDFEALLHPEYSNHGATAPAATSYITSPRNTAREKKVHFAGSRGIFMENWLSIFSQSLVLLKNSSHSDTGSDDKYTNAKKDPSSRRGKKHKNDLRIETTQPAQIGQVEGIGGLLSRLFLRKDSSFVVHSPKPTERNQYDNHTSDDNDSNDYVDYDISMDASSVVVAMPSLLDLSPRSNDSDAYNDMFSSSKAPSSSFLCGMSLCFTGDDSMVSSTTNDLHRASHDMSRDIQRISEVLGEPLRLVLDLKSRRVPPKVWSRLIDTMRSRGLVVDGIGSFDMDELRIIAKSCSCPLTPILFFHSVGDLQRACHANEVKKGDTVYFNGGSLMWKPSTIMEAAERGCCGCIETADVETADDDMDVLSDISLNKPYKPTKRLNTGKYSFQPYAYPRNSLSDWERVMCKSTLECYQKHFNLKVGVYVQEFSISPEALDALAKFVNAHGSLYDQGMAFGGVNGVAIKHIHGDGYWNQRYVGRSWDFKARPANHMMPLKPEDHHIVQKAIQAGAWAQVASTYEVTDEMAGAMTLPNGGTLALKQREPCNPFQPSSSF